MDAPSLRMSRNQLNDLQDWTTTAEPGYILDDGRDPDEYRSDMWCATMNPDDTFHLCRKGDHKHVLLPNVPIQFIEILCSRAVIDE